MSAPSDSYDDIAVRWYRPVAVTFLRRWLPCAGILNLLVLGGEWIREDLVATMLASSGVAALVTLCALVIGAEALPARSRRICWLAAVFVSASALAIGLLSLVRSSFSFYDLFSRAWLIGPGGLTLFWLVSQEVRVWFAGQVDGETAAAGLARH
ncbi:MAG: hypothetical protein F4Z28_18555, partial [Gammaproteobacteria bacterium]|nr:hypothetical protein [Gammaproteobacteria bacterium]